MKKISVVLIVDDMEIEHIVAKFQIEEYNETIKVVSAYDGQEALEILNSGQVIPDVIFLDINMPGMNGFDFLQAYEAQAVSLGVAIAMLSSSNQPSDKERCEAYDFVKAYIAKPLEREHLEVLEKAIA